MDNFTDINWHKLPNHKPDFFKTFLQEVRDAETLDAETSVIVEVVNQILVQALRDNASAIHIESLKEGLQIRFRKEEILQQAFPLFPNSVSFAIITRFQILANLKGKRGETGRIACVYQGEKLFWEMSLISNIYGPNIFITILNELPGKFRLERLIINQETRKIVTEMTCCSQGLIIVTGPRGSGKTTTLYSLLAELNNPEISVYTIEKDVIKYKITGVTQMSCNLKNYYNYYRQAIIRRGQDLDVIMVGETRNKETAQNVMEAVLVGNLVLTELHTSDAAGAIVRLDKMGIEPYLVSEYLIGVISQRLLRRVCPDCAIAYTPTPKELSRYGDRASYLGKATIYKAKKEISRDRAKVRDELCSSCNGIGYQGWVGVYEVLPVTKQIKSLINQMASSDKIREVAREEGMKTFLDYALDLVLQKHTTLEEIDRQRLSDPQIWGTVGSSPRQQIQQLERQINELTAKIQRIKRRL